MRARVELVIRDEQGHILSQLEPYQKELGTQSLHEIEGAVENWRQQVLPDIEVDLLSQAQSQFPDRQKKRGTDL